MFGKISMIEFLIFFVFYVIAVIATLIKLFKTERGISLFLWMAVIIFTPFLGSFLYFLYDKVNAKKALLN
jgi:hypothetical protein